jgi:putative flippase GtrA
MSVQMLARCGGPAASSSFGRFAGVGLIGWGVQVVALFGLTSAGVHYVLATALAVEFTVLHNFVWHELYTWRNTRATSAAAVAVRLLRFNVTTAVVSIVGNVMLTALLVECLHVVPAVANALAVPVLSIVNYAIASRWIFASRSLDGASAHRAHERRGHRAGRHEDMGADAHGDMGRMGLRHWGMRDQGKSYTLFGHLTPITPTAGRHTIRTGL